MRKACSKLVDLGDLVLHVTKSFSFCDIFYGSVMVSFGGRRRHLSSNWIGPPALGYVIYN